MRKALGAVGAAALGGVLVLAALAESFAPALSYPAEATPPGGSRLGVAEIGTLAEQAGFRGSGAAMAIAVTFATCTGTRLSGPVVPSWPRSFAPQHHTE